MAGGETVGEKVARLEARLDGHEEECKLNRQYIGREMKELKGDVSGLTKGAWGVVVALLAWAATQLWTLQVQAHAAPAPPPAAAAER